MSEKAPYLSFQRGRWFVVHSGKRFSTGETERRKAESFLDDFKEGLTRADSSINTEELLSAYLKTRSGKPGQERLRWAHKQLNLHLGPRPVDALGMADFDNYAQLRYEAGVSASTVRTELQALRAALRWHMGEKAPKVGLPPKPVARDRWLTREEADQLLAACRHSHVRLFVMLALHTAARAGAILALEWSRVDLDRNQIDYRTPGEVSTRKRKVPVPINDALRPELVAAKAKSAGRYVIEFGGDRVGSVRHGIDTAAQKAGLGGDITPHVFRHTAATWMAQSGVPLWEIAGLLGHSDATMVAKVYAHHCPTHLRRAADALAGPTHAPASQP